VLLLSGLSFLKAVHFTVDCHLLFMVTTACSDT